MVQISLYVRKLNININKWGKILPGIDNGPSSLFDRIRKVSKETFGDCLYVCMYVRICNELVHKCICFTHIRTYYRISKTYKINFWKTFPELHKYSYECTNLEYSFETNFRWRGKIEHSKVSDKSRGDWITSTSWGSTGSTYGDIFYFLPEELLSIVESSEVLVLSEQFYGWLWAIGVQLGHVQVIHKDYNTLTRRSTYYQVSVQWNT